MNVQTEQQLVVQMKTASTQLGPIFVNVNQVKLKPDKILSVLYCTSKYFFEIRDMKPTETSLHKNPHVSQITICYGRVKGNKKSITMQKD